MSGTLPNIQHADASLEAKNLGCEAIYVPDEEGTGPGKWQFSQKYDEGIIWKRMRWPWVALRNTPVKSDVNSKNLSKQVRTAESYLKDQCPEALVPQTLLMENLRESKGYTDHAFNQVQGELLALGLTRYARAGGTGRLVSGQWKRLCVAFPSGDLRTYISLASVRWLTSDESDSQLRVPFVTERSKLDISFKQQIQQIVFPPAIEYTELSDYFAVRTVSEVSILTCSRTEDKCPFLHHCLTLPSPLSHSPKSKFIADTVFAPNGTQIATITNQGSWKVYDLSLKRERASVVSTGSVESSAREHRSGWWKIEWTDNSDGLIIAESTGLHFVNIQTGVAQSVMSPEKKERFLGLTRLDALQGGTFAVLTTSEVFILEIEEWRILLRQKHRRDLDPSLALKVLSREDVTNIIIYSRLNALVTVHQLSEDIPLNWLDTPFELPLPRNDPNVHDSGPNLGFVIIPSDIVLNGEDYIPSEGISFTTYRLQSDLSIVGDMYGTQDGEVRSFTMKPFVKNTEILSPRLTTTDAEFESEEEWTPFQSNWKLNFSLVAKEMLPSQEPISAVDRRTRHRLRNEIIAEATQGQVRFDTMAHCRQRDMLGSDPEELTSTMEQVGHHLEEKGYQVRPLHIVPPNRELDPEEDPGSIASIYNNLIATLPPRGLNPSEMNSKLQAIREIAVDVGLANIGVLKPAPSTQTSLNTLRKFLDIDGSLELSEAAKFVVGKWGEDPEIKKPQQTSVKKRRRVRLEDTPGEFTMSQGDTEERQTDIMSQVSNGYTPIPMSQPERGRHGARVARKRIRRSGF